jgi:hypothetical protein
MLYAKSLCFHKGLANAALAWHHNPMLKRVKHESRNQPSSKEHLPTKAQISMLMASLGRKGGKIGGKRRLQTMTAEERKDVARKAARARWNLKED